MGNLQPRPGRGLVLALIGTVVVIVGLGIALALILANKGNGDPNKKPEAVTTPTPSPTVAMPTPSQVAEPAGDPAATVKAYFASRTCAQLQEQMSPADWRRAHGATACQDAQVSQALSTFKVTIKKTTIEGNTADVDVSVSPTSSSKIGAQSATVNLVLINDQWKVDRVIAKAS